MHYQVHLTMRSRNEKTGPIPVSTTERKCCPNTCPLKANGCYAEYGPLALHWRKVDEGKVGTSWANFCDTIRVLPTGQLWRHNQAGDLPSRDGVNIDAFALNDLAVANMGKRGFTYTHHDVINVPRNRALIEDAVRLGFTISLSADNLGEADRLSDTGLPVVSIVPSDAPEAGTTPAGRRYVVCPAQTGKAASCAACALCQKANRKVIVAFWAHGTGMKKANVIASTL